MITDEDEAVLGFNIDLNSDIGFEEEGEGNFGCSSGDQHMPYDIDTSHNIKEGM